MRVRQLLEKKGLGKVVTVEPVADVPTAARLLMQHQIGGLPVADRSGRLVGFVAERELVRAFDHDAETLPQITVERIMRRPPPVCSADDSLYEVMERMTRGRLRHVVVVDGGRPVDIMSVGDLVKHRLDELETETGVLRDYLAARRALS
jgi:CBS domain-containing protein